MKNFILIVLVLAVGGGGYYSWSRWQKNHGEESQAARITTAAAERRDIQFAVSAAGEIGPAEQVSVRPEINGRIASLLVDIGDQVKRGDVLFTLDDQELRNERDSSQTEIDRAKLQLAQTERNYHRASQLHQGDLISQEEFENFKTELDLARNALTRSQKQLAILEERLTKTKIVAPFDCTVLARPVSVGQAVSGSGGVGGGTEVLAIANLNAMIIQAHINQADVTRLKTGQEVDVQVEAVPGLTVMGKVERIAPQATIKNNIKGFLARVLLRNVDPRIRPGMTANIKIPVAALEDVIAVPLSAVYTEYNQESGRTERYVFVQSNSHYERRPVQVGLSDFFHAEIQNGLAMGELVCLEHPPQDKIITPQPTASQESHVQGSRLGNGTGGGDKPITPSKDPVAPKPVAVGGKGATS